MWQFSYLGNILTYYLLFIDVALPVSFSHRLWCFPSKIKCLQETPGALALCWLKTPSLNAKEGKHSELNPNVCFLANFFELFLFCTSMTQTARVFSVSMNAPGGLKHAPSSELSLCGNPSLSLCSNVRITVGAYSQWLAGRLTDHVPRCENLSWLLQCQCVGMCWCGGEEREGGRSGGWGPVERTAVAPPFLWEPQTFEATEDAEDTSRTFSVPWCNNLKVLHNELFNFYTYGFILYVCLANEYVL